MTLADRLRQLAAALPSDGSAVTLTRADLVAMLEETPTVAAAGAGDLTVDDVAAETKRAPSTVRGWLIAGDLTGYKLNGRDWRVPRASLRAYLDRQSEPSAGRDVVESVDIGAWRRVGEVVR